MDEMKPIQCHNSPCTNTFIPTRINHKYCCRECGRQAHNKQRVLLRKQAAMPQVNTKQQAAWDEINTFMKRYKEETGRYITYGKAVRLMEQEKEERRGKQNGY